MENGLHISGPGQEVEEDGDVLALLLRPPPTRVAENPPEVAPNGEVLGGDGVPNGEVLGFRVVKLELEKNRCSLNMVSVRLAPGLRNLS